jgi:hypothetical protein
MQACMGGRIHACMQVCRMHARGCMHACMGGRIHGAHMSASSLMLATQLSWLPLAYLDTCPMSALPR